MNSGRLTSKPDLYVVARIIAALRDKGATKRTVLATSTGVAYDRLVTYIDWMAQKQLISIDEEDNIRLTELGLATYDDLVKWILQYIGRLKFPRLDPAV